MKFYPDCARGTACGIIIEGARRSGCAPLCATSGAYNFLKNYTGPPGAGTFAGRSVSNRLNGGFAVIRWASRDRYQAARKESEK